MFKRLYSFGGIAYVIGGVAALAAFLAFLVIALNVIPDFVSEGVFGYALITFLVSLGICTIIFDSGSMQVVAQNHTTEALERISRQLAEQADAQKQDGRSSRRPRHQRKQAQKEPAAAQVQEHAETPVAVAAPQEGYHCPVTKTVIPVR